MFQIIWPTVSFSQRVRLSVSIIIIQLLCTQLQEKSLASFATVKNEIKKKKIPDRAGKSDIDTRRLGFFFFHLQLAQPQIRLTGSNSL